ncbi:coiled-coil domain-containing protein 134 isoform X1 [Hydra vulgaris]|nr:coiled-coil domain-containing protein 134 isoform X1 [Hydra vulgaris]
MNTLKIFELIVVLIIAITCNDEVKEKQEKLSRKELYKYGFRLKRNEQVEGVKRILMMEDELKRSAMVKILLDKIFKVVEKAKTLVEESGYVPGDEFPEDQKYLDALGNVFENVALFGDLLLRCPDITHKLYDKNTEWRVTMNWGVVFSNESGLFDDAEKFLNLVAQELEIIPRDPNYINPYKEATIKATQKKKEAEENKKRKEIENKKKKKTLKKNKKGPRLGGSSGEL